MLLVVIVSKQVGTGQLVLHCSAAALSPTAFQYCLSGEGGGCLWCLGGVLVLSGWCLCVVKGVIVPKQVRKVQLVTYHATTALSPSALNCYPPLFMLLELPSPVLREGTIFGQKQISWSFLGKMASKK